MSKPDELNEWISTLSEFEQRLSASITTSEKETWQHMADYASNKILKLEKELYGAV